MKLCAVADMHGRLPTVPECEVLVIAGDICPDISFRYTFYDPDLMRAKQMEWLASDYFAWEQTVPAKHIFATPGNHDWVHQFPEHCRSKMFIDEGTELGRVSFWFTPWVPPVGHWNYMLDCVQRRERFAMIPKRVTVLAHHGPARHCGDRVWSGENVGCFELRAAINDKQPAHTFFGHIHEGGRDGLDYQVGGTQLHHVSMPSNTETVRVFHI